MIEHGQNDLPAALGEPIFKNDVAAALRCREWCPLDTDERPGEVGRLYHL